MAFCLVRGLDEREILGSNKRSICFIWRILVSWRNVMYNLMTTVFSLHPWQNSSQSPIFVFLFEMLLEVHPKRDARARWHLCIYFARIFLGFACPLVLLKLRPCWWNIPYLEYNPRWRANTVCLHHWTYILQKTCNVWFSWLRVLYFLSLFLIKKICLLLKNNEPIFLLEFSAMHAVKHTAGKCVTLRSALDSLNWPFPTWRMRYLSLSDHQYLRHFMKPASNI